MQNYVPLQLSKGGVQKGSGPTARLNIIYMRTDQQIGMGVFVSFLVMMIGILIAIDLLIYLGFIMIVVGLLYICITDPD